jgi:hypothetical protein
LTNKTAAAGGGTVEARATHCPFFRDFGGGAALEVVNNAATPARFVLAMPGDGLQLPCRAVWRRDRRIGIAFG